MIFMEYLLPAKHRKVLINKRNELLKITFPLCLYFVIVYHKYRSLYACHFFKLQTKWETHIQMFGNSEIMGPILMRFYYSSELETLSS